MILVTLLSYRRPRCLAKTLDSFTGLNGDLIGSHLVLIALDQEHNDSTSAVFRQYSRFFHRVFTTRHNLGIGWGFSQLLELSRLYAPEFILFLEDDWVCRIPLDSYLPRIYRMFLQHPRVGTLRLRNVKDPVATVNHVSGEALSTGKWEDTFLIGNYHYVFNPHLVRARLARRLIPAAGEHHAQILYHRQHLQGAQLMDGMFDHIGKERAPARISRVPQPLKVVPHRHVVHKHSFFVPLAEELLPMAANREAL
jgi:hypothetical protein